MRNDKHKSSSKKDDTNNDGKALLKIHSQEYKLPIIQGNDGKEYINISELYKKSGCFAFDPGFKSTASCRSSISRIDGEKPELQYRGYSIEKLVSEKAYEEVCYLLFHGELPDTDQLTQFIKSIRKHQNIEKEVLQLFKCYLKSAHPMSIMSNAIDFFATIYHEDIDIYDAKRRGEVCLQTLGKASIIAAMVYKHKKGENFVMPKDELSLSDNLLHMMFSTESKEYEITPEISKVFNQLLILHAEHEQNVSTSSVRVVGSSGTNPFSAISAGISSLWGPLHGGANEAVIKMLQDIGSVDKIPDFMADVKDTNTKVRLMGFGHRVYRNYDPRGKALKKACDELFDSLNINIELFEIAKRLEQVALQDEYFISRKLFPNIDFYSGLIYLALGIPAEMFTVIFATARIPGWLAQWSEMISDPETKIARPRQIYTGFIGRG